MNDISIKTRVMLLTLTPLLLISLILGYYLAVSRIQDSENCLRERGDTLVRNLARESEFGLFSEDARHLDKLAALALREEDVYEITIQNADKKTISQVKSDNPDRKILNDTARDEPLMKFESPVYRSGITITDHEEQYEGDSDSYMAQGVPIGWIEITLTRANILARQAEIVRNIILLTIASSVLCALIALWMSKGIVYPILRLSHAVEGIRKGRLGTRVESGSGGEIGQLENGFNAMANAMEMSQARLHDEVMNATSKLSLLLESLPVAVFSADLLNLCRISFITPSIKQLTGFDAEEFSRDGTLWTQRMHADDREKVRQGLLLLKETGSHEFEYRWQMQDGGYHWFYSYVRVYEKSAGSGFQVIGMWQDISELKKVSQQLEHTISVLQEKNQELKLSRNEAVAASRNKAAFLANMSHEIRTPLSSIIGYASKMESCLKTVEAGDTVRQCAHIINHASSQLKRIIDDILSFSKLESGSIHLEQVPFDLRAEFEDVVCMMSTELRDKKVELSLLFDSGVPTRLVGDPGRISQVLMNLLGNAIKFTWNGSIDVLVSEKEVSEDQVELDISVTDTGIGMTEDVMKNIFNPFQQGDASIARRYGGTGLGLSIVSRLVGLWGGKIGVDSTPSEGSRFWFTLKCQQQEVADDFVADERIKRKRILIYDDHPPSLRAARNLLLAWSADVYQARSRCQIKSMIDTAAASGSPYDIVIVGAGVKEDEPGSIAMNVLLKLIRESHDVPMLLMMNRQRPLATGCAPEDGIGLVEKPLRRDVFYRLLCRLLKLNMPDHACASTECAVDCLRYEDVRVLLAEDNEFNRALITAILEARGVAVTQVHDGTQALARAAREDYDLVIMDIHLPGMDGTETARRIRTLNPFYKTVPIIALTADVFFDAPENLARNGIDACLLKPLDEEKLWRLINTLRATRAGARLKSGTGGNPARRGPVDEPPSLTKLIGLPSTPPSRDLTNILPALADSLEDLAQRLDEALGGNDPRCLRAIIHEIKGVVCYFGITDLSHAVHEAEKLLNSSRDAPGDIAVPLRKVGKQIAEFAVTHGERLHEINRSE